MLLGRKNKAILKIDEKQQQQQKISNKVKRRENFPQASAVGALFIPLCILVRRKIGQRD